MGVSELWSNCMLRRPPVNPELLANELILLSAPGTEPCKSVWLAVGVALLSPRLWPFQKLRFSSFGCSSASSVSEYSVAVECDLKEAEGDMLGFRVLPEVREEPASCTASLELLA